MAKTAKRTLTVILPDGSKATRKTARTYTHVIVSRGNSAAQRERNRIAAIGTVRSYIAYYEEQIAAGVPRFPEQNTLEQIKDRLATAQETLAELEARDTAAAAAAAGWSACGWAGRLDLAQKEAARFSQYDQDVTILPVEA